MTHRSGLGLFCLLRGMFWFPGLGVGRTETAGATGLCGFPWADSVSSISSHQTPESTSDKQVSCVPSGVRPHTGLGAETLPTPGLPPSSPAFLSVLGRASQALPLREGNLP